MTEKEAVAYLGLSARTLRTYRRAGKLAYREVPSKTRPVIEYDPADLSRLKSDLENKRLTGKKVAVKPAAVKPRIAFVLQQSEYTALIAEAAKYGMSAGEYARQLTREGLESRFREEADALRTELAQTNADVKRMHKEFASAFEVVLEYVGLSPEEAKKWVTDNLR